MTLEEQKERMITGKLYNDLTEELVNARKETVRLTDRYNRTYGEEPQVREQVLKQILGSMGENVFLNHPSAVNLDLTSISEMIFMRILTVSCWMEAE